MTRPYRMVDRADRARQTGERILMAALEQFADRPYDEVSLQDVADAAGVTVQTVLRRFGSKADLVTAAGALGAQLVRQERASAPRDALDNLAEHYERWGDRVLRLLAQEERVPGIRAVTEEGRRIHAEWVEGAFGPQDPFRLALLIAATDVYVWKLLRRDRGLSVAEYRAGVERLVRAALA